MWGDSTKVRLKCTAYSSVMMTSGWLNIILEWREWWLIRGDLTVALTNDDDDDDQFFFIIVLMLKDRRSKAKMKRQIQDLFRRSAAHAEERQRQKKATAMFPKKRKTMVCLNSNPIPTDDPKHTHKLRQIHQTILYLTMMMI